MNHVFVGISFFSYPSLDVSRLVSLSFLSQYPELLVASYNNNEDAPHEPDGVALVWNIKFKKATPEYIFHCQVRQTYTCQASHLFLELMDASPDVRRLQGRLSFATSVLNFWMVISKYSNPEKSC